MWMLYRIGTYGEIVLKYHQDLPSFCPFPRPCHLQGNRDWLIRQEIVQNRVDATRLKHVYVTSKLHIPRANVLKIMQPTRMRGNDSILFVHVQNPITVQFCRQCRRVLQTNTKTYRSYMLCKHPIFDVFDVMTVREKNAFNYDVTRLMTSAVTELLTLIFQ